ncbi:MAG: YedE-related selenium metabolism membrane protein [Firmicutes bacterium]|nr:YedE-related selenium metabolism membrane protein [Bacillota bacterium]
MDRKKMLGAGLLVGVLGVLLVLGGNPKNMGVCVVCFLRDIAGALGFHRAAIVQNIRLEIPGFILGSFIASLMFKEFRPRGGSSTILRFFMGALVSISALVFLGCPLRMILRLAGGDLNAFVGLLGFTSGIAIGIFFLKRGFTLGRSYPQPQVPGYTGPAFAVFLIILAVLAPAFIFHSESGPGSLAAPLVYSLGAGLLIGFIAQRTRLCMVGGIRDMIMFKDSHLLLGFVAIFVAALVGNLVTGNFKLGFVEQPIAHSNHFYNYLGMLATGLGAALLGGCPLRQLILAGEGDSDAMVTVMGLIVGAAVAHNFGLAASGAGVPINGQIANWIVLALLVTIGFSARATMRATRTKTINAGKEVKA